LLACIFSNVTQRLSHASFTILHVSHDATNNWQHLKKLFHKSISLSSWISDVSRVIPSQTISPNSTSSGNNSLEMISYKMFACKRNFIFIFHVWKLLPFNFSIFKAQEVDAIIVSKTMLDNKTPRNLKWQNARQKKIHPMLQSFQNL
jgi:hypothetical protein